MSKLTHKIDPDTGLIEFYIDDSLLTTWAYEDEPEIAVNDFEKIFNAGKESTTAEIENLKQNINELIEHCNDLEEPGAVIEAILNSINQYSDSSSFSKAKGKALELISEINEYLNTNKLTSIAYKSILHQKCEDILSVLEQTA